MDQLPLQLLGRIDAPSLVPLVEIAKVKTFREACRMCWLHRRVQRMTVTRLAEETGMRASHLPEYLHVRDLNLHGKAHRDMPGKHIPAMERVCGNTFISQWLGAQSSITALELVLSQRSVA